MGGNKFKGIALCSQLVICLCIVIQMAIGMKVIPNDVQDIQLSQKTYIESNAQSNSMAHTQAKSQLNSALEKHLRLYFNKTNQELNHTLQDIHVSAEQLGQLSMDEVMEIAKKTPATGAQKNMDVMDRVVLFLNQEKKMIEKEKEQKRQEAMRELVAEENAQKAEREAEEAKYQQQLSQKQKEAQLKLEQLKNQSKIGVTNQVSGLSQQHDLLQTQELMTEGQLSQMEHPLFESISGSQRQGLPQVTTQRIEELKNQLKQKIGQKQIQTLSSQPLHLAEKESLSQIQSNSQESLNIEDNMSISELIAQKYKKNIVVNQLKTPDQAAKVMIKDTNNFNVNAVEYTEGTSQEQQQYEKQLGTVETNLAAGWKDLAQVKQNLWKKLHAVKEGVKANIESSLNNLSQTTHKNVTAEKVNKLASQPISMAQKTQAPSVWNLWNFSVKLFEVDTVLVVVVIILVAILICCCILYWCTCCWVSSEARKAQREQAEAYDRLVEEQKEKKRMEAEGNDMEKEAEKEDENKE